MRRTMLATVTVLATVSGVVAAPSLATKLTARTAGQGALMPGAEIRTESSSEVVFATAEGNFECTSLVMPGSLETNGAGKDTQSISSATWTGGAEEGRCKTTTPLGAATVTSEDLPWSAQYTIKAQSQIKGKKLTVRFATKSGVACIFSAAKIAGTFTTSGPAVETFTNQTMLGSKKLDPPGCPKEARLSGTFALFSGVEPVELVVG